MRKLIVALITMFLFSCQEEPSYNPFDSHFNVSVERVLENGCDTISAGCGWFNLQVKTGRLRPFYQVDSGEDFYKVVAKGFEYYVDTIDLQGNTFYYSNDRLQDSILNLPYNKAELNKELGVFGYRIVSVDSNRINIVNHVKKDTVELRIDVFSLLGSTKAERRINYWKSKPRLNPQSE
jgi:hypothetical protein